MNKRYFVLLSDDYLFSDNEVGEEAIIRLSDCKTLEECISSFNPDLDESIICVDELCIIRRVYSYSESKRILKLSQL